MLFARTVCRLDQQMVGTEGLFSVRCTHSDFSLVKGEQVVSLLCFHSALVKDERLFAEGMLPLDEVH